MPIDPMTDVEQHDADASERFYESRYENEWRQAVDDALVELRRWRWMYEPVEAAETVLLMITTEHDSDRDEVKALRAFNADKGTPALLRVIAQALELSK